MHSPIIQSMSRKNRLFRVIRIWRPCPSPVQRFCFRVLSRVNDSIEKSAKLTGIAFVHTAQPHVRLPIQEGFSKRTLFSALLLVILDMDDFLLFT
jgi:hypothetical protein